MCVCQCSHSQFPAVVPVAGLGLLAWGLVHAEWLLTSLTTVLVAAAVVLTAVTAVAVAVLVWLIRSSRVDPDVGVYVSEPLALPRAPLALPPAVPDLILPARPVWQKEEVGV